MRVSGSGGEPVAIGVTDATYPQMLPHGRFFYTSVQKAAVFGAPFDHPAASVEILKEDVAAVYAPRAGESGNRGDGFLLWIRGTTLLAQAFDPNTMRRAGESMVLADPAWTVAVSSEPAAVRPGSAHESVRVGRSNWQGSAVGRRSQRRSGSRPCHRTAVGLLSRSRRTRESLPRRCRCWTLDVAYSIASSLSEANTSPVLSPDGQTVLFGGSKGLTRIATSGVGDPDVVSSVHEADQPNRLVPARVRPLQSIRSGHRAIRPGHRDEHHDAAGHARR